MKNNPTTRFLLLRFLSIQKPLRDYIVCLSCSFEARGGTGNGNRAINSYLELGEGETTTGTNPSVVLNGRASHKRSELVDGAGSQSSSLGLTSSASPGLAAGLFEEKTITSQYLVSKVSNFSHVATFCPSSGFQESRTWSK